jgi:chitodextrinase
MKTIAISVLTTLLWIGHASAASLPTTACTKEQLEKTTVYKHVKGRSDIAALVANLPSWTAAKVDYLSIARATVLDCDPVLDSKSSAYPPNLHTVTAVLPLEKWNKLTSFLGQNEPANTFDKESYSYNNFLRAAGRYPFFCAEKGVFPTVIEACKREIASIFAHGAQETGAHSDTSSYQPWQQAFAAIREQNCYPNGCVDMKASESDIETCKTLGLNCSGQSYFGRGIKQVTYWYNYLGFSMQFLNNAEQLLKSPDEVAKDGVLGIGSGLWFYMSPQPPKPSMHDVITGGGGYHPLGTKNGITIVNEPAFVGSGASIDPSTQTNINNPEDKFMTTISLINGAVECTPKDNPQNIYVGGDPSKGNLSDTESAAKIAEGIKRGANRMNYYGALLKFLDATIEPGTIESTYETNTTGCTVANGNPFTDASLAFNATWWVTHADADAIKKDQCSAVSWQAIPPLSIASSLSLGLCHKSLAYIKATASN